MRQAAPVLEALGAMKNSAEPLLDLAAQIESLRDTLANEGFASWAKQLDADANLLRAGKRMGCANFLSHFGGMGSLNDIQVGSDEVDVKFQRRVALAKALARENYPSILQQLSPRGRVLFVVILCAAGALFLRQFFQ